MTTRRGRGLAVAAGFGGLAVVRLAAADRQRTIGIPAASLLPFTPQAAAAAWVATLLLRDDRARVATAAAAAALTTALVSRTIRKPAPAATGPVLRVLTANLLAGRAPAGPVVELVRRLDAEVLFVQELGPGAARRLTDAGLGKLLPHSVSDRDLAEPRGNAIYARYPLTACQPGTATSSVQPMAMLALPAAAESESVSVRLVCVHLHTPKRPWSASGVGRWRHDLACLAALPIPAWSRGGPLVVAGDFNSTVDHAGFRQVLASGLVDAASQAGQGLVPTWGPAPGGSLALLTIDHVLADQRCAVLTTSVHSLPGTDHRALFALLRLPSPASSAHQLHIDRVALGDGPSALHNR